MIHLSVNVNKIATLRNARGGRRPSVPEFAAAALRAGAHGITVHPRPDERHITRQDVFDLIPVIEATSAELPQSAPYRLEYNLEGYPDRRFLDLVKEARPHQATLVPDPPDVLTSDAGWKASAHRELLREVIGELRESGIRVSLFMETELAEIDAAAECGADRIELYTGPFAEAFEAGRGQQAFAPYVAAARHATSAGLGLNAGHDLDLHNLEIFRQLPGLEEVSIGHALTCDALERGWQATVEAYLEALAPQRGESLA
ncbi:MAG: pyridoxine 5'-phosphate synthase [Acidobacteriota bacterium]